MNSVDKEKSRNATIALSGLRFEKTICTPQVLEALLSHCSVSHTQQDDKFVEFPSGKKTDCIVHPQLLKIQIKKICSFQKNRGHHIDRRSLSRMSSFFHETENVETLMKKLFISKNISENEKQQLETLLNKDTHGIFDLILCVFLGEHKYYRPQHIVFIDTSDGEVCRFYICHVHKLIGFLLKHYHVSVKKTCIHFGKNLYLQRRGGSKTDSRPNDIQTKFCVSPEIKDLCILFHECSAKSIDDRLGNIQNNTVS